MTALRILFALVAILAYSSVRAESTPVVPPLRCSSETEYGCYDHQLWIPFIAVQP